MNAVTAMRRYWTWLAYVFLLTCNRRADRQAQALQMDHTRAPDLASLQGTVSACASTRTTTLHTGAGSITNRCAAGHHSTITNRMSGVWACTLTPPKASISIYHRQHAQAEQDAKLHFDRAKHSLLGLPYCRFCRCRMGTWQSLTKHVTQGMCLRIKMATAVNQPLESPMGGHRTRRSSGPSSTTGGRHSPQKTRQ